jgi:crossover junction endodeoxyribonuclease RuvC
MTPPPQAQAQVPLRVLAVDPALRKTGYAILEQTGKTITAVTYGVIENPTKLLQSGCLIAIRERLSDLIKEHRPTECAIESTIFVQSYKTAIVLGSVRGAVLIAAAEHGLPIYDYAPREVKQAAVGRGAADKTQVAFMIRAMLRLRETPPPDAADAIAAGLAHFQAADAGRITLIEQRRI